MSFGGHIPRPEKSFQIPAGEAERQVLRARRKELAEARFVPDVMMPSGLRIRREEAKALRTEIKAAHHAEHYSMEGNMRAIWSGPDDEYVQPEYPSILPVLPSEDEQWRAMEGMSYHATQRVRNAKVGDRLFVSAEGFIWAGYSKRVSRYAIRLKGWK